MSDIDRVRQVVGELFDEEARDYIAKWKRSTQKRIDDQLESGAIFVISSTNYVHTRECPTIQHLLNVDAMWPFSEGLEIGAVRDYLAGGGFPRTARLLTSQEVNDDGRYERCRICAPDVAEKRPRVRVRPSTAARNLYRSHIGRTLEGKTVRAVLILSDGAELIFEDDSTLRYASNDRVYFEPEVTAHPAAES